MDGRAQHSGETAIDGYLQPKQHTYRKPDDVPDGRRWCPVQVRMRAPGPNSYHSCDHHDEGTGQSPWASRVDRDSKEPEVVDDHRRHDLGGQVQSG